MKAALKVAKTMTKIRNLQYLYTVPKTKLGKWAVRLIAGFFLLFILVQIIAAVGRNQGAFDSDSFNAYQILIPATIIPAGICGIAAFFTGIISIIKSKERSVLVFLTTVIGFLVLIFVLGEILVPH